MTRTNRRETPPIHIAVIEAVLQERGWSVAQLALRTRTTGRSDLAVSLNTLYRVLRGSIPSWPVQAEIAAALSDERHQISATQLFGPRALPAWASELIGETTAVAA